MAPRPKIGGVRVRFGSRIVPILVLTSALGCTGGWRGAPSPIAAGFNPVELLEPIGEADADANLGTQELYALAERLRQERRPAVLPPVRNILVLSGGGTYGAYSAGVLYGWTQSGQRPQFDVVTGVSTGALIAPLAFLGSDYDEELKTMYTSLKNTDVFRIRKTIKTFVFATDSLADNSPLAEKIEQVITPDFLRKVALEHGKGRRLYISTTELESRRQVIWDLGEIARRGTPTDLELFRKLMLGSAAIPGFFPPVRIPVTVNGRTLEELHLDGSVSNALFFRPPYVPNEKKSDPNAISIYGSNMYIVVAGKIYADPDRVSPRSLHIAANSVSTLIYSQSRGDLLKLYMTAMLTGMNYNIGSIPADAQIPKTSTDFNPVEMTKMFELGRNWSSKGCPWRTTPPDLEPGEGAFLRAGTDLRVVPLPGSAQQPAPTGSIPLFPRREIVK